MPESKASDSGDSDFPDPKGMQGWLEHEITDIMKAAELRIREATNFVNAYARGELTTEQAAKRGYEYSNRWGDALPGVQHARGRSDSEILERIEEMQKKKLKRWSERKTEAWRGL